MKTRNFIALMVIIALIAVMYSPSSVRITSEGFSTSPTSSGGSSTSLFLSYIKKEGYKVVLLNNSLQLSQIQGGIYLLIGPDFALSSQDASFIQRMYDAGKISLLIAEGNSTNNSFLRSTFGAIVPGSAVIVPSSPFVDKRVYVASFQLGQKVVSGIIDISSYLVLERQVMHALFVTPVSSFDTSDDRPYPRIVIATSQNTNSKALIIADSGPFTNSIINTTIMDEKGFALSLFEWVTGGDTSKTVYYDNYHYISKAPQFSFGLPVGPVFDYALSVAISNLNSYYQQFPLTIQGFTHLSLFDSSLIAGTVVLISAYALVRRVLQKEKIEKDDMEPPQIEANVVSFSRVRLDFEELVKKKSFYAATAERLYQLLDEVSQKYLGLKLDEIPTKLNDKSIADEKIVRFVRDLVKIHEYVTGRRRYVLVFRWKRKIELLNAEAEIFLEKVGAKATTIYIKKRGAISEE